MTAQSLCGPLRFHGISEGVEGVGNNYQELIFPILTGDFYSLAIFTGWIVIIESKCNKLPIFEPMLF